MFSKDFSWRYVDVTQKLSDGPCDLVSVTLMPSAGSTGNIIYNDSNSNGGVVLTIESATRTMQLWQPPVPIYCDKGLYVVLGTGTTALLVQWRETRGE